MPSLKCLRFNRVNNNDGILDQEVEENDESEESDDEEYSIAEQSEMSDNSVIHSEHEDTSREWEDLDDQESNGSSIVSSVGEESGIADSVSDSVEESIDSQSMEDLQEDEDEGAIRDEDNDIQI